MKHTLRIPTLEQYAYIETAFEGTVEEAVKQYNAITRFVKGEAGPGLETKEFNRALDEYIVTNELRNGTEIYREMSRDQQMVFQEVKKAFKRIKQ